MKPARMPLPTRGWEKKDVWFLSFQFAKFFCDMIRAVMSKRMDKRSHAWPRGNLIFAVYIFNLFIYILLFAAAHYFRSLPSQLTQKHTDETLKGGRADSASRLNSNRFEEG